ncbi:MAG: sulfatase [Thermoanaerobaculia bacterium]
MRLLDGTVKPEVTWPQGRAWPASGLRDGSDLAPYDSAGPPYIARVRLGEVFTREERLSLVAPAGSSYRYALTVPDGGRLRFGVGVLDTTAKGGSLQLQVRVGDPGSEGKIVYDRNVAGEVPGKWFDEEVDLAPWNGKRIDLQFIAPPADSPDLVGAWSAPHIFVAPKAAPARPNVVWISLDTLRADHLSSYGYGRPTTPTLDALAARGLRFSTAISQAPWTRPSHRSMLSGVYPASRGGLNPPKISEVLYRNGYQTFAATGGGQVDSTLGFDRGFEIFRVWDWIHESKKVVDWTRARAELPFFLFLHCYEIHEPYTHTSFAQGLPAGRLSGTFSKDIFNQLRKRFSPEEKEYAKALYDSDIAFTDGKLAELFAGFESAGMFENSIVIVTSDHGEQFWEHGSWGHGQNLYDHQIHIPLLVYLPKSVRQELTLAGKGKALTQGVIDDQVELVDLYPTLLELLHIPLPAAVNGRSLVSMLQGGGSLPAREAFSEHTNVHDHEQKSLRTPRFKFILSIPRRNKWAKNETFELYDLKRDPGEQIDLAPGLAARVAELRAKLGTIMEGGANERDEEVPANIDEDLKKQLKALGYIGN